MIGIAFINLVGRLIIYASFWFMQIMNMLCTKRMINKLLQLIVDKFVRHNSAMDCQ